MKYLILLLAILSFGGVFYGFLVESEASQKFIGFGVVGIFFLLFPLFSYFRWKDRDLKDYMITKENLDKMRGKE